MARGALGWSLQDLADRAAVGVATVARFETEASRPTRTTLLRLRRTFEEAGLIFIEQNGGGPGVRLRSSQRPGGEG
nr:helix-turn-helix domain-containing protein [Roseicella frigidaeris]